MALVNLANAKGHLREIDDSWNVDIQQKADQATALVLARCNTTAYWRAITPTWTEANVPQEVQTAILLVLGRLWDGLDVSTAADFWWEIDNMIATKKDPVIA